MSIVDAVNYLYLSLLGRLRRPRARLRLAPRAKLMFFTLTFLFGLLTSHPNHVRWESIMQGVLILLTLAPLCCILIYLAHSHPRIRQVTNHHIITTSPSGPKKSRHKNPTHSLSQIPPFHFTN